MTAARKIETMDETVAARPIVKSAGGKARLVPKLLEHVPTKFGTFFEPFVGGAAMYFALAERARKIVLGDANVPLMRMYMGVRDDVDTVIELLGKMPYRETFYYAQRKKQRKDGFARLNDAEVAAWFIYINKAGYNGLWRVNKKGQCNVPFGRYTNPTICDEPNLRAVSALLKRTRAGLRIGDFEKTVKTAEKGDLVYFDPPYVPTSTTADFTSYTADGFTLNDQTRLRDVALVLKKRGVHVVLSNADVPIVRKLYKGFKLHRVKVQRAINSDPTKRGDVGEVIIT